MIVSITDEPDAAECSKHEIHCSRVMAHPDAKVLEELTKLIEANKITPIVSQTFPLAEVARAHQQVETHHTRGKVVLPQVAPLWTSYALYRFESNSRSATVLGLIGAGGIGQLLFDALNAFAYHQLSAIIIVIIVAVTLIDLLSQAMRSRLL